VTAIQRAWRVEALAVPDAVEAAKAAARAEGLVVVTLARVSLIEGGVWMVTLAVRESRPAT
jgi:hypothetical protein